MFRRLLPSLLAWLGVATMIAAVLLSVVSLGDNPVLAAVFLVVGAGIGASFAGLGALVEHAQQSAAGDRQRIATMTAQTRALEQLIAALSRAE